MDNDSADARVDGRLRARRGAGRAGRASRTTRGFAGGAVAGAALATAPLLLFLNPDARPAPGLPRRAAPPRRGAARLGCLAGAGDDGRRHAHQHGRQRGPLPRRELGGTLRPAVSEAPVGFEEVAFASGAALVDAARGLGAGRRLRRALLHVLRGPRPVAAAAAGRLGGRDRAGRPRRARVRLRQGRPQVVPARAQPLVDDPGRLPGRGCWRCWRRRCSPRSSRCWASPRAAAGWWQKLRAQLAVLRALPAHPGPAPRRPGRPAASARRSSRVA